MSTGELTTYKVPGKAESLASLLLMKLSSEMYSLDSKFPSAQELAQGYGVSLGTARKAMGCLVGSGHLRAERGAGHFVSLKPPPYKESMPYEGSVQDNMQPSFLVVLDEESLAAKHQQLLGTYVQGIMAACDSAGYNLEIIRNDGDKLRERLNRGTVSGILCYYLHEPLSIDTDNIPVIAFGHRKVHPCQHTIVADVEKGVYEAYRYLFSLGHDNLIMLVTSSMSEFYSEGAGEYLLGMRRAFADYGVAWSKELVVGVSPEELESDGSLLKSMIESGVTGMFVPRWSGVLGVYRQARDSGLLVGADLSVVAFGNHSWADLLEPDITRISWDPVHHGERAVSLIQEMSGDAGGGVKVLHMPVHLSEGESCNSLLLEKQRLQPVSKAAARKSAHTSDEISSPVIKRK